MAANTAPIFPKLAKVGQAVWKNGSTANTKSDGAGTIGTSMLLLMSAGTEGSMINKIRALPAGSTASTATTATVLRVYLSSISTGTTTADDTSLIGEIALPSQTTDAPTASITPYELPLNIPIPPGMHILVSMHHVSAANTVWHITGYAGDY